MVHTYDARSGGRTPGRPQQSASDSKAAPDADVSAPMRYVLIPDPMIISYAHDPLTVGVYAAIARLTVAAKGAVPLAAADLVAWMGSSQESDRAAVMRRIVKLQRDGWLLIERSRAAKHQLLPTWGCDRSGIARPWRWDRADSGRPEHLRGRRVPIALFDDYLGRLDPQPGRRPAVISRYLTRPLLDLADIGTYIIGLRAEQQPTPRLRHLGLAGEAGMLPPAAGDTLLALAAADRLTTLDSDQAVITVRLSTHGYTRFGIAAPAAAYLMITEHPCGSTDGSASRSAAEPEAMPISAVPERDNDVPDAANADNAWDVGMLDNGINHDSSPPTMFQRAGGERDSGLVLRSLSVTGDCQHTNDQSVLSIGRLDPLVVAGHRDLNPNRLIPPGEWWEVLASQQAYSAHKLLIWQARASRAQALRPQGITPAYYAACAGHEALAAYRPRREPRPPATVEPSLVAQAVDPCIHERTSKGPQAALDPTCAALLRSMGVRQPATCAEVSEGLIRQWQAVIDHPGLVAHFADPIGFAVAEMRYQHAPPAAAELERWARRVDVRRDPYQTWRHLPPLTITDEQEQAAQQRVAHARAIAPADAGDLDITFLVLCFEEGLSDAEAIARLRAERPGTHLAHGEGFDE